MCSCSTTDVSIPYVYFCVNKLQLPNEDNEVRCSLEASYAEKLEFRFAQTKTDATMVLFNRFKLELRM
jgi:hypothetical protein